MLPPTQKYDRYETPKKKYRNNIPSFGLILFFLDKETNTIEFLMQQRRDTFEYVEFVQGVWSSEERLKVLFVSMSEEERERILNYSFQELWDDLWIDKTTRMYRDGYNRALKKYDSVSHNVKNMILDTVTSVQSPPWGFPKGRKSDLTEKDQDCAIRETEEETRMPRSDYDVLPYKFSEKFQGSNGSSYSTVYFLCKVANKIIPENIDTPLCIRKTSLSEEVADIKWVPYEEAHIYLNSRRLLILHEAFETIKKHYSL